MVNNMDLEIRQFTNTIINFINKSPLPMEVKRLSLKDILAQVEDETNKLLQEQLKARETANTNAESEVE